MLHSRTMEATVGLFIAVGLGALLVLSIKMSNLSGLMESEGYRVTARFDNIGGLKVRSPVKMAGVLIGRIESIGFDSLTYEAITTLKIDPQYNQIPADSIANIFTAGLLGEQYIALDPGGDEQFLADGDELELSQSAMVLEQLIGKFLYDKAAGDDKKSE